MNPSCLALNPYTAPLLCSLELGKDWLSQSVLTTRTTACFLSPKHHLVQERTSAREGYWHHFLDEDREPRERRVPTTAVPIWGALGMDPVSLTPPISWEPLNVGPAPFLRQGSWLRQEVKAGGSASHFPQGSRGTWDKWLHLPSTVRQGPEALLQGGS